MERFRQEKSLQRALDGLRQLSASLLSSSDPAVPSKASGLEHGGSPCRANLQIRSMVDYQELVSPAASQYHFSLQLMAQTPSRVCVKFNQCD